MEFDTIGQQTKREDDNYNCYHYSTTGQ